MLAQHVTVGPGVGMPSHEMLMFLGANPYALESRAGVASPFVDGVLVPPACGLTYLRPCECIVCLHTLCVESRGRLVDSHWTDLSWRPIPRSASPSTNGALGCPARTADPTGGTLHCRLKLCLRTFPRAIDSGAASLMPNTRPKTASHRNQVARPMAGALRRKLSVRLDPHPDPRRRAVQSVVVARRRLKVPD